MVEVIDDPNPSDKTFFDLLDEVIIIEASNTVGGEVATEENPHTLTKYGIEEEGVLFVPPKVT